MKNYRLLQLFFVLLVIGCSLSCKKKSNNNPYGNVKISSVSVSEAGSVMNYSFFYDAINNIDSMVLVGSGTSTGYHGVKKFTYFGSSYSITDEHNNTFSVNATTAGQILKILIPDTLTMLYKGNELGELDMWNPSSAYPFYTIFRTTYTWQGGDLISNATSGVTGSNTFDYDKSKPGQPGDAWRIGSFLAYGRSFIKTTHLPQDKMTGGTWSEKYFYTFDGSGRISQFTKVNNNNGVSADDTIVYNYSYY